MDYTEHIKRAIDYIEINIKHEIDLTACAKAAGYSKYHFLRIFMEVVKLSPSDYIRKRRLTEVIKQIDSKSGSLSDIAFEYGFNSSENFIRSFKKEHKILPTEYVTAQNSLKLYEPYSFKTENCQIEPQIIEISGFDLTVYKCDENYPFNFWNKYNSRKYSKRLSGGADCEDYGVSVPDPLNNRLNYFIGIESQKACGDISGTVQISIPGGLYAVFTTTPATHYSFVYTIHKTWNFINKSWRPQTGFIRTVGYEFEVYLEQSRIFSEKIYIPIIKEDKF